MTRIYEKKVEHCIECPAVGADQNVTRWVCNRNGGRMICWMDEGENEHPIPDWCKLKKIKKINEKILDNNKNL